jgi:hypothetical protein
MLATNDLSALKARRAVANSSNRKLLEISAVLAEFPKETVVSPKLPEIPNFVSPLTCMGMHSFPDLVLSLECC